MLSPSSSILFNLFLITFVVNGHCHLSKLSFTLVINLFFGNSVKNKSNALHASLTLSIFLSDIASL